MVISDVFLLQRQIFYQSRKWFEFRFPYKTSIFLRLKVALEKPTQFKYGNIWSSFPVNIQTTLICNTSITFLCRFFLFSSAVYFLFIPLLVHLLYLFLLKQHSLSIGASKFGISFPEPACLRSAVEITGGHAFKFINEERVSAVIMLTYL